MKAELKQFRSEVNAKTKDFFKGVPKREYQNLKKVLYKNADRIYKKYISLERNIPLLHKELGISDIPETEPGKETEILCSLAFISFAKEMNEIKEKLKRNKK